MLVESLSAIKQIDISLTFTSLPTKTNLLCAYLFISFLQCTKPDSLFFNFFFPWRITRVLQHRGICTSQYYHSVIHLTK